MTWPLKRPIGPRDIVKVLRKGPYEGRTGVVVEGGPKFFKVKITECNETIEIGIYSMKRIGALTAKQNIRGHREHSQTELAESKA